MGSPGPENPGFAGLARVGLGVERAFWDLGPFGVGVKIPGGPPGATSEGKNGEGGPWGHGRKALYPRVGPG